MKKPILYVIMGPNGSGKSTFGTSLLNNLYKEDIYIYDSDLRYQILYSLLYDLHPNECIYDDICIRFKGKNRLNQFYAPLGKLHIQKTNSILMEYFKLTLEWYHSKMKFITEDLFFDEKENYIKQFRGHEFGLFYQDQMKSRLTFGFETPFSFWGQDIITECKKNNYYIIGLFFGLNTFYESISFVKQRELIKGHSISKNNIQENFNYSFVNINRYMYLFDELKFVNNTRMGEEPIIFAEYFYQTKKEDIYDLPPQWYQRIEFTNISDNQLLT